MTDETSRRFQSAVPKNRAGNCFEHVGEQRVLLSAATLLFSASEPKKLAQGQTLRRLRQRRRTDQAVLHSRQLTFGAARITPAKIICDHEAEHGIAEELERFVVQFARLELVTGSDPLVGPRTMGDRPFEQRSIFEVVIQNRFEEVEVRDRFGVFQSVQDYNKRRKLVLTDELPALR